MDRPDGKWIWGEMRPLFEANGEESLRARQARVVSRFALSSMLALFVRTLLWVLDGVFYSNPAEIRLYSVGVFLLAGFSLWQILDLKAFARRLFIGVAALTWGVSLVTLLRTYALPALEFSAIQTAEYVTFLVWTVVSVLFVLYLLQPKVRESFTVSPRNSYQRTLFVLILGHVLFFEWKSSQTIVNVVLKIGPAVVREAALERLQKDCVREEGSRLPAGEEAASNFCQCDSKLLSDRCSSGQQGREQCLRHIEGKLSSSPRARVLFQEAREACVAQFYPKDKGVVYQKARAVLERNVLQRLSVSLPLEKITVGEKAQRKFLYCMSAGLFSRCRDPKPSAAQACLTKPIEAKESQVLKSRCLRLAEAKAGEIEKHLEAGEGFLAKDKFAEAVQAAEKSIALASNRPEGHLLRGIALVHMGQTKNALDDLALVLEDSDFAHTRLRALEARRSAHLKLNELAAAEADAKQACELGAVTLCPVKGAEVPQASVVSDDVAVALSKAVSEETSGRQFASLETEAVKPEKPAEVAVPAASAPVVAVVSEPADRTPTSQGPVSQKEPEPVVVASSETAAPAAPEGKSITDEHRRAWSELMQVGEVTLKMGDGTKAQEKFLAALKYSESLGVGNELWVDSSLRMAAIFRENEKNAEGDTHLRKIFPYWSSQTEARQRSIVEEVGRFSTAFQSRRDWKFQERLLLEVWKEASDSSSLLVRDINLHLSTLYQASGRTEKLEAFYKREAEIYEKRFGKRSARVDASRGQLSDYYLSLGQSGKASAVMASPSSLPEGR